MLLRPSGKGINVTDARSGLKEGDSEPVTLAPAPSTLLEGARGLVTLESVTPNGRPSSPHNFTSGRTWPQAFHRLFQEEAPGAGRCGSLRLTEQRHCPGTPD